MKKVLLILTLLLTAVLCFSQNSTGPTGLLTLFQVVSINGEDAFTSANSVWLADDKSKIIVECYFEGEYYAWTDSIVSVGEPVTKVTDIDRNGELDQFEIRKYFTKDGSLYKFIYVNGDFSMISTATKGNVPVHFMGTIKSRASYAPIIDLNQIRSKYYSSYSGR